MPEKPHITIVPTPIDICTDCGQKAELRPYGKEGAWVCFACAMKDEPNAQAQFQKQFLSKDGILVLGMPPVDQTTQPKTNE